MVKYKKNKKLVLNFVPSSIELYNILKGNSKLKKICLWYNQSQSCEYGYNFQKICTIYKEYTEPKMLKSESEICVRLYFFFWLS